MKKHLIYLCIASVLGMTGCTDVNDEFEGLKDMTTPENMLNKDYTLTVEDYAAISALKISGVDADALSAVKTNLYLTSATPAKTVLPAFMNSKWGTASKGSAIKMTYDFGGDTPAYLAAIDSAQAYELTDKDYETIWGVPDKAYLNEDKATVKNLSGILAASVKEPKEGDYAIVSYKYAEASEAGSEETYDKIEDVISSGSGKVKGTVVATYSQGFLLTDGTSFILVYLGDKSENAYATGDVVVIEGSLSKWAELYQFTSAATVTKLEAGEYEGTVPNQWDATEMDAYLSNPSVQNIVYTGTLSITENDKGNKYYNVTIEGAQKAVGSIQYPAEGVVDAALDGKKVVVTGYAIGVSSSKYVNTMAVSVKAASASGVTSLTLSSVDYVSATMYQKPMAVSTQAAAGEIRNVVYVYENEKWVEAEKVTILNPADYKAMGEPGSHNNFSSSMPAGNYLPKYLAAKYPYANDGDVKAVVYNYYDSEAKATVVKADEYVYDGAWKYNNIPVETVTEQYAYSGSWMYDPNVTITLTVGRGNGDGHFQALTDWVWENVDVPAGVTKEGQGYMTSYKNNEYYFGGSEYQNNFDFRPSAWRAQIASAYESLTDEQLTALMWERLPEAVKIMLSCKYPDARPVDGLDVIYTVNFGVYDGSATVLYTIQYEVTAPGEFTYVEESLKKAE
ncbi:hypothetical protein [Odoribacter lunatus]|uniref:hypothetical protein n=1 Tax=Odoribacter lunatus TaxID=2941335 RepID=UPI00203D90FA|nr:hypothetical protein [Odoribacter lunatus]